MTRAAQVDCFVQIGQIAQTEVRIEKNEVKSTGVPRKPRLHGAWLSLSLCVLPARLCRSYFSAQLSLTGLPSILRLLQLM